MNRLLAVLGVILLASAVTSRCSAQTLAQRLQQESAPTLAGAAAQKGNAANGAVLFADQKLGCANCHAAGRTDLLGPDLSRLGKEVTPALIIESLLDPSKSIRKGFETVTVITEDGKSITGRVMSETKTELVLRDTSDDRRLRRIAVQAIDERKVNRVSSMPAGLADKLQSRQQFLDLTRYVIEVVAAGPLNDRSVQTQGGGKPEPHIRGLALLNELNCAKCHQLDTPDTALTPATAPDLTWVSGRVSPSWLKQFISDPQGTKPGSRMPDVLGALSDEARQTAASELAHYIASRSERRFTGSTPEGKSAAKGYELFHSVGCVACHSPRDEAHNELLAGSVPLGEPGAKYNLDSLTEFLKTPHAARPAGLMPDMLLTHWEAIDLANYLLSHGRPSEMEFSPDKKLAAAGASQFQQHGCVKCHAVPGQSNNQPLRPMNLAKQGGGCLSGKPGPWPAYSLSDRDKAAIRAALDAPQLSRKDHINVNLTARKCLSCHTRGDLGGITDERDSYFLTANPNLGPQGRVPPTLTGVGAKLKPAWMRQVLVRGRRIRPYVTTRMPQYGAEHVGHLVDLFQAEDKQPALPDVKFATDKKKMREAGFELAGTKGLNCIVCHTFQMKPAATMPAVDLTEMSERLHKDWFRHYMRNPQRLSPNTVMPSFWPGGKAIRKDVLAGDPDQQVEALWQWLLDGRQARTPRGLIREPMELLATKNEAVMLRRAYPGIGKRGIGVGYPLEVNLAYDAEQLRLAMVWKGKFADPGGVWRSQGHGQVRPLSRPIQFAKGPDVWDAARPWKPDDDRPNGYRFLGYRLDDQRRPTFEYKFDNVRVQDYSVDTRDNPSGPPLIRRRVEVRGMNAEQTIVIRATSGNKLVDTGAGVFRLDSGLRVRIPRPFRGSIIDTADGQELRVTLSNTKEEAAHQVEIEYRW